ncbi:2Fe-2S iron-sulfur cluster-binding protein [Chroococcidiopsis sp. CCNUC1]|uniref:2Fe-2S iron-sulfur cluster-binding protein n=1 Tax=Chroococcidiopsis sp. CCNUC1 TaxID=2653189 RepID=UPI0020201AE9|nr:2Fe-2S iron-sulfur cluster-binding protein [Chroococcidiopsis sp. CCNUC1]URD53680.1 (2Fe-2S)-binding protein [Chroococcidiopsis sp. CCNUC1]
MPKVTAQGKSFECPQGANLRQVLLQNGIELYNGATSTLNCHGLGTCGTCAVQVEGAVSEPEWRETTRRSLPPHALTQNRRLACQTQVLGDVKVTKFEGSWGQGTQAVWTPKG